MKRFLILMLVFILALSFISCKGKAKLASKPVLTFEFEEMVFSPTDPMAKPVFKDFVKIDFKLYVKDAPKAVGAFLSAVKAGYFNGTEEGTLNQRTKFRFSEVDHIYFEKLKFDFVKPAGGSDAGWIKNLKKVAGPWEAAFAGASNIDIVKGTLCINSNQKGDLIVFKAALADKGKFIPIGKVTPESMEALSKLFELRATTGDIENTPQGQVATSSPVSRAIFIKKITVSE